MTIALTGKQFISCNCNKFKPITFGVKFFRDSILTHITELFTETPTMECNDFIQYRCAFAINVKDMLLKLLSSRMKILYGTIG